MSRAPVGIAVIDYDGVYVSVNPAYGSIYGYAVEEMLGRSFLMVFPEEAHGSVMHRHQGFLDNGGHLGGEWTVVRRDGTKLTVWSDSVPFPSRTGHPDRLVYVLDISQQKEAQEQQRIAATVYKTTSDAILVTDADKRIIAANPAYAHLTGFEFAEVVGTVPEILRHDSEEGEPRGDILYSLETAGLWSGEGWDERKTGDAYLKNMRITTVRDIAGKVQNYVLAFSDITEKRAAEDALFRQANFDSVTGLPNRHMFHLRLERAVDLAKAAGTMTALILLDLDNFKEVNDTLGHSAGDTLLAEVAGRLRHHVREDDTAARVGGDEFALILTGLSDIDCIEARARDVLRLFEKPAAIGDERVFMSASLGIAIYPDDTLSLEELFKNADQALYAAKASGRGCLHFFTRALSRAATERKRMASDLRRAIAEQQFEVHYQPIIDLRSGRIAKAEALIRWHHPSRGFVSPGTFIPLAEETGLIVPLGDWVARQAIAEVVRCRQHYNADFQITVNLSPVQLRSNGFAGIEWIREMLAQGVDGSAIGIEITEGMLLSSEPAVMENFATLREAGIKILVDDFGTGYSSLAYLRKFAVDTLKIDGSFIADLEGAGRDICEAIIVMAHRLGLDVVAEGVETTRQCDILRSIGCDFVQGYLFASALPAGPFEALLHQQHFPEPHSATVSRCA
jgi:diguanylate cyclase (GGDEF)-like protein/PAS domain S-box-containing protein